MKIQRFDWDGKDARGLAAEIRSLQPDLSAVSEDVARIIDEVATRGDAAVLEMDEHFSGVRLEQVRVDPGAAERALEESDELRPALELAANAIRGVAEAEAAAESPTETTGELGQRVSVRSVPVQAAGAYVPGGTASYPSSVLMCCIPARSAGVERLVVATPPGVGGEPDRSVLAACAVAGADEIWATGGVQAVASLALGTQTLEPVDVVVGPGNRYVQEAKRQLFGRVGIEGIAGPSELMVLLDGSARLQWVALDLLAQAEHGPDGLLVAAAEDPATLDGVLAEVERLLDNQGLRIADVPLAVVRVPSRDAGVALANALAPEHLELVVEGAEELAADVRYAGCVFLGASGATAFGDYAIGSNHVLPTGGAGRFAGPLGPRAFRRRLATVTAPPNQEGLGALARATDTLARAEGFPVHGESALARAAEQPGAEQ